MVNVSVHTVGMDRNTRVALAERVRGASAAVAEEVTDRFLARHPDWLTRYGERARTRGIEDARYHLSFLASAFETGTPATFVDYARWTAGVLEARGIRREFLAETLRQVSDALSERLPGAADALRHYVDAAVAALANLQAEEATPRAESLLDLTRAMYVQAVLAGERSAALTIVTDALRNGASAVDVYVDVLQAALYEVGRLWESNRITVAHEHAATAITQFVTAHLYDRLERSPSTAKRGTMVLTGLEGELHSIGALMVADVLETRGWTVHFLGTNLPHASIVDTIRRYEPDCVGISATMLFNLPAVRRLIESVRDEWGRSKRIMLGGGAFRRTPELWRELGADGHAGDLRQALSLMCQ
jgi:methanogenic corrinoid protein MtbC1